MKLRQVIAGGVNHHLVHPYHNSHSHHSHSNQSEKNMILSPIQDQLDKLASNTLLEFKIGFNVDEFPHPKRDVRHLLRVIENEYLQKLRVDKHSCLKSIRIGYHLPTSVLGPILQEILPLLLKPPAQITTLQLSFDCWIPEPTIKSLVSCHTLTKLELGSIRIRKRAVSDFRHYRRRRGGGGGGGGGGGFVAGLVNSSGSSSRSSRSTNVVAGLINSTRRRSSITNNTTTTNNNNHKGSRVSPLFGIPLLHHTSERYYHQQQHGGSIINAIINNDDNDDDDDDDEDEVGGNLDDNVVSIIPYISDSVEVLRLVDSNLQGYHLPMLCETLEKKRNIHSLSLRHNRNLGETGGSLERLFNLTHLKSLDLSICDLDQGDAFMIAKVLKKKKEEGHRHPGQCCKLEKLNVAGNYRMSRGIPAIVEAASTRLVAIDCSFCEVQNKCQSQIFKTLAKAGAQCTLRSLKMQGTRIKNVSAITECILNNQSLENIMLNHPREPNPIMANPNDIKTMMQAIRYNYYLQVLEVDVERHHRRLLKEGELWLNLNKCGRRLLIEDNHHHENNSSSSSSNCYVNNNNNNKAGGGNHHHYFRRPKRSWSAVITTAAQMNDKDVLFWLLKHGSSQF